MSDNNQNKMNRRNFFKLVGGGAVAATGATLIGCNDRTQNRGGAALGDVPKDKMTYRTSNTSGDKVSILGYGCMRWPLLPTPAPDGNVIDQEAVNELVDYALAHGVNYFDTSPVYVKGWSENATGKALASYPSDSYYSATKL